MENENEEVIKVVHLDLIVYNQECEGDVKVNMSTGDVDLCELEDKAVNPVYYRGYYLGKVREILCATALDKAEFENAEVSYCEMTGYCFYEENLVYTEDEGWIHEALTIEWEGNYYYAENCSTHQYRNSSGYENEVTAPESFWEDCYYCDCCNCYVNSDDYYGEEQCIFCHEDNDSGIIEDYCDSHCHEPIFYGDYKEEFVGLGFELEVDCDCDNQRNNSDTAEGLCGHCGLDYEEMRYAHDGSLNYGFECISQPHTVKDFWDKADKWRKMLKYLSDNGYRSHDTRTCGLHVHVSRGMFGKTEKEQDKAIAKVYTFFDENWDDIVKVSRRKEFGYCEKNSLPSDVKYDSTKKNNYEKWKVGSKSYNSHGHHVALNNGNSATFEYRLGRGTLNAWSFFSWIDFVLTITKNAKRITDGKVISNDLVSWLGGIKESTAKYIYKRGAFRKEMLALYPNIEWETDLTDSSND